MIEVGGKGADIVPVTTDGLLSYPRYFKDREFYTIRIDENGGGSDNQDDDNEIHLCLEHDVRGKLNRTHTEYCRWSTVMGEGVPVVSRDLNRFMDHFTPSDVSLTNPVKKYKCFTQISRSNQHEVVFLHTSFREKKFLLIKSSSYHRIRVLGS